jgi:hypothetical protein
LTNATKTGKFSAGGIKMRTIVFCLLAVSWASFGLADAPSFFSYCKCEGLRSGYVSSIKLSLTVIGAEGKKIVDSEVLNTLMATGSDSNVLVTNACQSAMEKTLACSTNYRFTEKK